MICPFCKETLADTAKFCIYCGKPIPRCPGCGEVIHKRMKFCIYDGTKIPDEILAIFSDESEDIPIFPEKLVDEEEYGITEEYEIPEEPLISEEPYIANDTEPWNPDVYSETSEQKKQKRVIILLTIVVVLLIAALGSVIAYFWMSGSQNSGKESERIEADNLIDEDETLGSSEESHAEEIAPEEESSSKEESEEESSKEESQPQEESSSAVEEESSVPVEESSEMPEEAAVQTEIVHTYEIIVSDLSWEEAKKACEERGGYLATITSQEEYEEICRLADNSGLTYLWLGASQQSESEIWGDRSWITGEQWTFDNWFPGEPSGKDEDGTRENCLCLWNVKYKGTNIGWTFNDQRNNLVGDVPSVSGKLGYVCEYEKEVEVSR